MIKVGDRVISDLDGLEYIVVQIGSRDNLEPLQGVKLIGDCVILQNDKQERQMVYSWEITELGDE